MSLRVSIQSASCCHAPASTSSAKKLSRSNLVRTSLIGLCSIATQKKSANAAEELMVHNEQASTFYQDWPNAQPSDIIPYVSSKARRNDPKSVLKAMDAFWKFYPTYNLGPLKREILKSTEHEYKPKRSVKSNKSWKLQLIKNISAVRWVTEVGFKTSRSVVTPGLKPSPSGADPGWRCSSVLVLAVLFRILRALQNIEVLCSVADNQLWDKP